MPSSHAETVIQIEDAGPVTIPGGAKLLTAEFFREGDDLMIVNQDGSQVRVEDYFGAGQAPDLSTGASVISGHTVSLFAQSIGGTDPAPQAQQASLGEPAGLAQSPDGSVASEPIAEISDIDGEVIVIRANGSRVAGHEGTPLYEDDIVTTGEDSTAGLRFVDEMTFSLGSNARMLLDDFTYEPEAGEGGGFLSVLQGAFSFVSGEAAHFGLDSLKIETPTMTIGVRGTKVAVQAAAEGETSRIALLAEDDGTIGKIMVTTDAGQELLSEANTMVEVVSRFQPPSAQMQISSDQMYLHFGSSLSSLPRPDYGQDASLAPDATSPLSALQSGTADAISFAQPARSQDFQDPAGLGHQDLGSENQASATQPSASIESADQAPTYRPETTLETEAEAIKVFADTSPIVLREEPALVDIAPAIVAVPPPAPAAPSTISVPVTAPSPAEETEQGSAEEIAAPLAPPAANRAPVLDTTGDPSLSTIVEDSAAPAGDRVAQIVVAGSITDADGTATGAIAVTGVDDTNGVWQFSTDGGMTFNAIGAASDTSALLLAASAIIRFVPNADFNGTASFSYRAWDQSSGTNGQTGVDVSVNGGATAFSAASETAAITVNAVNDAPVLDTSGSPTLTAIAEDTAAPVGNTVAQIVTDGSITDIDGTVAEAIAVTSVDDTNGTWEYSTDGGATFSGIGAVSANAALLLDDSALVRFVPSADYNGTATFSYKAWDQSAGSSGQSGVDTTASTAFSASSETASITVTPVADARVLETEPDPVLTAIAEDSAAPNGDTVAAIVANGSITDPDGPAAEAIAVTSVDNSNGTWEFSTDGGTTFSAIGTVSANSALLLNSAAVIRFVPNADFHGGATFGYKAWDESVGTNGQSGVDTTSGTAFSAETEIASIAITAVADAPVLDTSGSPTLTSILENTAAPPGNSVAEIVIDGSITDADGPVTEAIAVTSADDTNGTWEYSIDGGATFNAIGAVSNAAALLLDSAAVVRFVPNASYNGGATISYKAWDQSSGSNGQSGVDTTVGTAFSAATETAAITVTAVNSTPMLDNSGAPALSAIVEDTTDPAGDTVAAIVIDGSITDSDGPRESIAVTSVDNTNGTWEYSTDSGATFNAIGAVSETSALLISSTALVRFVPAVDFNGTATFGYKAWDESSGTNGQSGVDTTVGTAFSAASETASITVVPESNATDFATGAEFQVNTTTADRQADPVVAALEGGGYVVTWFSEGQDGSGHGVFAQRYDAKGLAVGAEFQVNTETSNNQNEVAVTGLSSGGFVVAWTSRNQDGHNKGVFAQRYDENGNRLGNEFQVNSETFNNQEEADVAALTGGGFVVTWQSQNQDGSSWGIYGQRYDAGGNPEGTEFQINTTTTDAQENPAVAARNDGGFVVVWQSESGGFFGLGVKGQRYDAAGSAVGSEFLVNTQTLGDQFDPAVTTLDNGDFVVAWTSEGQDGSGKGIYAQRFDASGNKLEFEIQVNNYTSNDQQEAAVTALNDGGFLVSWASLDQDGSGQGVYAQRFNADGDKVGAEFRINTTTADNQNDVALASLESGGVVAAWDSNLQDGSGKGVFAHHFDSESASVTVNPPVKAGASALDFGGSNSFVDAGDPGPQSRDLDPQTGDFTVEAWFHYTGPNDTQTIVSKGNESHTNEGFSIFIDGNALVVRVNSTDGIFSWDMAASSIDLPSDPGWHHVAMVINQESGSFASNVVGYLDGSSAGWTPGHGSVSGDTFTAWPSGIDSARSFLIGANDTSSGQSNFFGAEIADVRVWNTARSGTEIHDNLGLSLAGDEANLIANWSLYDGSGTTAANAVAGGADGTLTGGASWTSATSFTIQQDTELDGRITASDPEGDSLSFSIASNAGNGTATIDATTGAWEYTPDGGFTGSDNFSYQISDGSGGTDTVNIDVTVTP